MENTPQNILVPVDFSDYSIKAARLAVRLANDLNVGVTLLHAYYSPLYAGGMPISDAFVIDDNQKFSLQEHVEQLHQQMDALIAQLQKETSTGLLPICNLISKFREGVPEEQILLYSKKHQPLLVIMGTHGIGAKEGDLLGSVTADILERCKVPVFAFPTDMNMESLSDIRHIGFITSFDKSDLMAFETMMMLLKPYRFKVYFMHLTGKAETWDEIKLSGIKSYFSLQYPELESSYCVIKGEKLMDSVNEFIQERALDAIVLTAQKRSIISRLFNSSLANKMLFKTHTPVLLLRG